jgi:hypothetical protein
VWFLKHSTREPNFASGVLFINEATFTWDGVVNNCDMHLWVKENPSATIVHAHQV